MRLSAWNLSVLACALVGSCTADQTLLVRASITNAAAVSTPTDDSPIGHPTVHVAIIGADMNPPVAEVAASFATKAPPVDKADPAPMNMEKRSPQFECLILGAQNRERARLGLEPLSWNPTLAQKAQRWADYLAATGQFEHAPENPLAPEGENLWAGTKGYYTLEAQVGAWIRERRFFRPGLFPHNSITGRVEDVGHYTQIVWRATREVGCAEATSTREDVLVCRYLEAGNYRGEHPFYATGYAATVSKVAVDTRVYEGIAEASRQRDD